MTSNTGDAVHKHIMVCFAQRSSGFGTLHLPAIVLSSVGLPFWRDVLGRPRSLANRVSVRSCTITQIVTSASSIFGIW